MSQRVRGGSSDHASFADVGVPILMFFSSDFSRIHTAADNTLEFIEPELLGGVVIVAEVFLRCPELAEAVVGN